MSRPRNEAEQFQPPAILPAAMPQTRFASAAVLLITLTGCAFFPSFSASFVQWDDLVLVVNNPQLNPATLNSLFHFWSRPHEGLFTPLAYTLWTLVASVFPPQQNPAEAAAAYHTLNVVLHCVATVLSCVLLHRLTRSVPAAIFGAALFAVHPLQVEPVCWVSGMNNVLAGALAIGAMLAYVRGCQSPLTHRGFDAIRSPWYLAATILLIMALLAKPTVVGVPLMVLVIDLWILRRPGRDVVVTVVPWIVLAAAMALVTRMVQPAAGIEAPPMLARVHVAADALTFYAAKFAWPAGLCIDYGRTPRWVLSSDSRYVTWLVPVALFVVAFVVRRRLPQIFAGLLIVLAALLPVLGLTPFDFQQYSTVADRYMYLGVFGAALAVSGVLSRIPRAAIVSVGTAGVIACAVATFLNATQWDTTQSLLANALRVNPQSLMANRNLAAAMLDAGRTREAAIFAARAVEFHPDSPDARMNAAAVDMALRDFASAAAQYQVAIELRAGHCASHYGLAGALAQLGKLDEALREAKISVTLDPTDAQARVNLGTVLAQRSDIDGAIPQLEEALRLAPADVRAMTNLAAMKLARNDPVAAAELLQRALEINPQFGPALNLARELTGQRK